MGSNGIFAIRNPFSRFELVGDKALFNRIVLDMMQNGGALAPSEHWNWNLGRNKLEIDSCACGYTDELFEQKYSKLQMMLGPWVGPTGMKYIDESTIQKYEDYLNSIDHLKLLPKDIKAYGQSNGWIEADLGSVMDMNLITAFAGISLRNKVTICEVGGGYGRLAEAFLNGMWNPVHYVLVDAVPGSLMYAHLYLGAQFPELLIGSYYNGDAYSEGFDCYVMPSWYSHILPNASFDICINVESMQEMSQCHVDSYFCLFDRVIKPEGEVYISNARDYVFRGEWNIPKCWETLFLHNTPRSWSADHPTHILRKRVGDFSLEREMLEGAFRQQITAWHQWQLIAEQQANIADRDRICGELQQNIADLVARPGNSYLSRMCRSFRKLL